MNCVRICVIHTTSVNLSSYLLFFVSCTSKIQLAAIYLRRLQVRLRNPWIRSASCSACKILMYCTCRIAHWRQSPLCKQHTICDLCANHRYVAAIWSSIKTLALLRQKHQNQSSHSIKCICISSAPFKSNEKFLFQDEIPSFVCDRLLLRPSSCGQRMQRSMWPPYEAHQWWVNGRQLAVRSFEFSCWDPSPSFRLTRFAFLMTHSLNFLFLLFDIVISNVVLKLIAAGQKDGIIAGLLVGDRDLFGSLTGILAHPGKLIASNTLKQVFKLIIGFFFLSLLLPTVPATIPAC